MLFIVNVHWTRRSPEPERPTKGTMTYASFGKTFTAARSRAVRKFNLHYGTHLAIASVERGSFPLAAA